MKNLILISLFFILFISGCSSKKEIIEKKEVVEQQINIEKKEPSNRMEAVTFYEIEGFFEDDLDYALSVFKKDCKRSKRYELFKNICEKAQSQTDGKKFFIINFQPYKLYDSKSSDEGIITGYYEPLLYGSLTKTKRYKYPVYKIPKNLILSDDPSLKDYKLRGKIVNNKIVPYDTRKEIEANPNNPNLEVIAYVDDKYDLFSLHIQGSGKIQLADGKIINVGYAQQNGWPFTGIGTYMLEKGYVSRNELSIQGIKNFFIKNPSKIDEVLNINDSYIFFRVSNESASGSLGSVLTAKRNLAVDKDFIPLGMPVFLNTKNPVTKKPINQLMVAADVGGAIKGEIRADFFWGFGNEAFEYAGRMKEKGKMYILMPKE
ncbi:MAG: murein transglycosylase A [Aliarcobacter sp.]|nr:murein transglycosylase A [Aliarcobacter sp.]